MPPLTEMDPNIGRRNSKSSNVSGSYKNDGRPSTATSTKDMLAAGSGIASMLRTTTEIGDIGSIPTASRRLPKTTPEPPGRRPSRMPSGLALSRTSSHYSRNGSVRSGKSGRSGIDPNVPGAWPYSHYLYATSQDFHTNHSDARSSVAQESVKSMPLGPSDRLDSMDRSFSFTQAVPPAHSLNNHRSMTSLKNQEMGPRPRSPYGLPPRFPPPGYRPSSPALSDTAGSMYSRRHGNRPPHAPRAYTASPMPYHHPRRFAGTGSMPGPGPHPRHLMHKRFVDEPRRPRAKPQNTPSQGVCDAPSSDFGPQSFPISSPMAMNASRLPGVSPPMSSTPPPENGKPRKSPHQRRPTDSTPYAGFVQRVKNVLEERISSEEYPRQQRPDQSWEPQHGHGTASNTFETRPGTVIEDIKEEIEPPLSPPRAAAGKDHPIDDTFEVKRLTRDMVKAAFDSRSEVEGESESADENLRDRVIEGMIDGDDDQDTKESNEYENMAVQSINPSVEVARGALASKPVEEDTSISMEQTPNRGSQMPETPSDINFSLQLPNRITNEGGTPSLPLPDARRLDPSSEISPGVFAEDTGSTDYSNRPSSAPNDRVTERHERRASSTKSLPMVGEYLQASPPSSTDEFDIEVQEPDPVVQKLRSPQTDGDDTSAALAEKEQQELGQTNGEHFSQPLQVPVVYHTEVTPTQGPERDSRDSGGAEEPAVPAVDKMAIVTSSSPFPGIDSPSFSNRRSFLRSSLGAERPQSMPSTTSSGSSSYDLRPSAMKNFQFPLPDLTEDSQEDASTTNLRMLGARAPGFRPRFLKDPRARVHHSHRRSTIAEPSKTYFNPPLADTHNIPTLNFSRQDLTSTLNDALGVRRSKSLEEFGTPSKRASKPETLDRARSSTLGDERYRSFFMLTDEGSELGMSPSESQVLATLNVEDHLLDEIERLSIPSVKNLTQRLSEILPSIKKSRSDLDFGSVDDAVRETVEEIREIGSPERLASMDVAFYEEDSDLDEDSVPAKPTAPKNRSYSDKRTSGDRRYLRLMKELPPLPMEEIETARESEKVVRAKGKQSTQESSIEQGPQLEGLLPRQQRNGLHKLSATEIPKFKLKKSSLQALQDSPGTPQPWKKDENYPWTHGSSPIDVSLSGSAQRDENTPMRRLKLKKVRSNPEYSPEDTVRVVRSMSPGLRFNAGFIPTSDLFSGDERPATSKGGIFSSLSRKIGLSPKFDQAGFPVDPNFLRPEERPVSPGDRYPTTGLNPPAGYHFDESRSFFSDDSSESEQARGLRHRLTRLRARRTMFGSASPVRAHTNFYRVDNNDDTVSEGSPGDVDEGNIFEQARTPTGMSKAEFHAKRLVERLITLLFRSSEVVRRNLHIPKRQPANWYGRNDFYEGA